MFGHRGLSVYCNWSDEVPSDQCKRMKGTWKRGVMMSGHADMGFCFLSLWLLTRNSNLKSSSPFCSCFPINFGAPDRAELIWWNICISLGSILRPPGEYFGVELQERESRLMFLLLRKEGFAFSSTLSAEVVILFFFFCNGAFVGRYSLKNTTHNFLNVNCQEEFWFKMFAYYRHVRADLRECISSHEYAI